MSVAARFNALLDNLKLTDDQKTKGGERREAVVKTLNQVYWNSSHKTEHSQYVGSWAKFTRIRPPRDVDLIYQLPKEVYDRFNTRSGNKQSQLLQEVRNVLLTVYPNTDIRGDGPVVIVPFAAFNVEVIPSFELTDGDYWICMTDNGGRYKRASYDAEIQAITQSDTDTSGNTRHLIRMMKCWQGHCSVPLKSFYIEILAMNFLTSWQYKGKSST